MHREEGDRDRPGLWALWDRVTSSGGGEDRETGEVGGGPDRGSVRGARRSSQKEGQVAPGGSNKMETQTGRWA